MFWQRTRAGMGAAALAAALATALTACGGDEPSSSPEPTIAGSSTTPTEDAAETEVREVVEQYWDAYIRTQNEPTSDPAVYEGIARGSFIETSLQNAEQYEETGVRRVGEPEISEPILKRRNQDAFVATQCFDERKWGAEVDGEVDMPPDDAFSRSDLLVERLDDRWLVTDTAPKKGPDPCEA